MELNEINELNKIAVLIIDLWENELNDDYVLYIDTHNIHNLPKGVIYGRDFLLSHESKVQLSDIPSLYDTKNGILNAPIGYVTKIALFNEEEFYYYKVCYRNNEVVISVGISSMIWGRSNIPITDVRRIEEHKWELVSSKFSRGQNYNGYIGNIHECLSRIINEEERLGSPYENMNQSYAMDKKLKVTIAEDGYIDVNNWFGI